ncbi:hypothetical protein FRC10_009542 [Ceratobasidium sp. 414]|nr:hypothetical protein FRC10_009542 [Ceratobasidium sp. 414]
MRWYEQQRNTSTRFRSIEHRRNTNGPFYHEFLLLKLTDGAVCRVERTGDGSREDAVEYTGCVANDLIQWFTAEEYAEFSDIVPSTLVAEIDLQREFDIIDVLAICYSIQNNGACSVYTLQRYNCYFFCWTILAIITRRLWETTIASDAWDLAVNSAVDQWSCVPPEETKKHMMLRTSALLDRSNPRATLQFLDPLRTHLASEKLDLSGVNQALGMTLWATSYESTLGSGLALAANGVRQSMYADDGACGIHLRRAAGLGFGGALQEISSNPRLADIYWDELIVKLSRAFGEVSKAFTYKRQLVEVEQPLSIIKLAQCKFLASVGSLVILFGYAPSKPSEHVKQLERLLTGDNRYQRAVMDVGMIGPQLEVNSLMGIYDAVEARNMLDPSQAALIFSSVCGENFSEHISSFVASALGPALPVLLKSHRAQLHAKFMHSDNRSSANAPCTVEEFQKNYLQPGVRAHAQRVAEHHLAAAELVEEDVQNAMAEVWKSMPNEFRGSRTDGHALT